MLCNRATFTEVVAMSIGYRLRAEAELMASSLKQELSSRVFELQQLNQQPEQYTSKLEIWMRAQEAAAAAESRLDQYKPHLQRPLECPYCWIINGTHSVLTPVSGAIHAIGCERCGCEYPLDD
jgi:hypothetical protein